MSCSVHDVVRLERRGIPAVAIGTEPFLDEALDQAKALGMPDVRMALIPHPVQLLTRHELRERADEVFGRVVERLTASPHDGRFDNGRGGYDDQSAPNGGG